MTNRQSRSAIALCFSIRSIEAVPCLILRISFDKWRGIARAVLQERYRIKVNNVRFLPDGAKKRPSRSSAKSNREV